MKFHIVSDGEALQDILFAYNLSAEEVKKENKHIRVWARLIPGTKLKIPAISEVSAQDLNDIEPFIEDYYPKLKVKMPEEEKIEETIIPFYNSEIKEEMPAYVEPLPINDSQQQKESLPVNNFQEANIEKIESKIQEVVKEQMVRPIMVVPQYAPYPLYRPIIYVIPRYRR